MKHAILASIGTDGDIYPFLALGMELRKRRFRVTLASHEHFAQTARKEGLEFTSIVSEEETRELLEQPNFWHPLKGPFVIGRWGTRLLKRHYVTLRRMTRSDNAFIVASPGIMAARLLQEARKIALVSVILQPWVIPSLQSPPVMMGGLTLPHWAPHPVGRLYYRLIDTLGSHLLGSEFKQIRAKLALGPLQDMFRWWFSPELVLGLFPEWFGPPQDDWPPQIRLTGFPVDGLAKRSLPKDLLAFCQDGQSVITFTFGTGMMHAKDLFREAIEACRLLGNRAVFLTKFRSQLPDKLPPFVHHCQFASFAELFPLCAAVVHHGGIGTVSNALAAGTPQLILPFAFDQMDNAVRVKKLGAGSWLNPAQRNAQEIAAVLSRFLNSDARTFSQRFAGSAGLRNGIECAANQIEAFTKARLNHRPHMRK